MVLFVICVVLWYITLRKPKQVTEIEQQNRVFYEQQLENYYELLRDANAEFTKAKEAVARDKRFNKYGGVISEKACKQHRADYRKWLNRITTLESRIHSIERRMNSDRP